MTSGSARHMQAENRVKEVGSGLEERRRRLLKER